MSLEALLVDEFLERDPGAAARAVERLPIASILATLESAAPRSAAALLRLLLPQTAVDCLASMQPPLASRLLVELPLATAAALLRRIPPGARGRLLAELPRRVSDAIARVLDCVPGSAGALMDPMVQCVFRDVTAQAAKQMIERHAPDALYYVYVVDRSQMLCGVVTIKRLMLSRATETVASIMRRDVISIPAGMSVALMRRHAAWADLDALPVIDRNGLFVGAVRHRDLRRLLRQPADSAPGRGAGLGLLRDVGDVFWLGLYTVIRSRFPDPAAHTPPPRSVSGSSS